MKVILVPIALATATALCACDTTNARKIDAHIGQSVADIAQAQILNPQAAVSPPALAPETGDGQRLKSAMDQYHKDVPTNEQKVTRPIVFEVGNQ